VITSLVVSAELREYPSDVLVDPTIIEASMRQSAIAIEIAVIALIVYIVILVVILTSKTGRFTGKRLVPALYLISSIIVIANLSVGMVVGLLSVRDAIKEHCYQYQAPSDAIITTGIFTPGVFSDSADSITSEFDNKVGKIDHLFDSYEKDSKNELSSGVYVGPLFAQNLQNNKEPQTSVITLPGGPVEDWVQDFYRQSEQRQSRAFDLGEDKFALITAQPDADHDWLQELTEDDVRAISEVEQTKLLETRKFKFSCGCTVEKILPVVRAMKHDFADLLSEQGFLEISCPRCGATYKVTPEQVQGQES
jgi:hypothetical protein